MPRKLDSGAQAKDSTGNGTGTAAGTGGGGKDGVSIEDQILPKSIVTRLAKSVLPDGTMVQKDAILALSKGGTVFINYLCATANDQAKLQGRKTLNPADVLEALRSMEFPDFLPRLEAELARYNQISAEKRSLTKRPPKSKDATCGPQDQADRVSPTEGDSPPASKKLRVGSTSMDPASKHGAGAQLSGRAVPARAWGDEDEEDEADMGYGDDLEDAEETESELEPDESPAAESPVEVELVEERELLQGDEDEALDNGVDSD